MTRVATYVFIDIETTGLPKEENNRTKITEISLVAVKRDHVLETRPGATPRVQHKLTLCVNPGRVIPVTCTNVTGLCNELLEYEPSFNKQVCELIASFLSLLTKPVCLIAQNGLEFDFPILRNHFERMKSNPFDELLCADCYFGFYDILEEEKRNQLPDNLVNLVEVISDYKEVKKTPTYGTTLQDAAMSPNALMMKINNETTPKQAPTSTVCAPVKNNHKFSKAKRKLPWSQGSKPTESYKLQDIYKRVLNRAPLEAHQAENDCIMAMECSVAKANAFVKWVDENCIKFSDVKPMGF